MIGPSSGAGFFSLPEHPPLERLLRCFVVVTVLANAAYMVSILAVTRPASGYVSLWDGWVFHIATTLPAGLALLRALIRAKERLQWAMVTLGILANTAGNLIYTLRDQNLTPIPFPAVSDAFYLLSYLAFISALLIISQRQVRDASRSVRVDGLIVGLSVGAALVATLFDSLLEQSGTFSAVAVGLAYPAFDVAFVVVIVAGLAPSRFRPSWASVTFIGGVIASTAGDVIFLRQIADDTYIAGTPLEWCWLLGILAFGLAAWMPDGTVMPRSVVHSDRATVLPGVAAFIALAVLVPARDSHPVPLAFWMAVASIAGVVARLVLAVRELQLANDAFRLARTDELTGLMNRRGFNERLDRLLGTDAGSLSTIMILDLNGFKEVNDSLGHHAGDHLLQIVARRFERAMPEDAFVGRLGGDEFGVVVPGTELEGEAVAAAFNDVLDSPISIEGVTIRIGAAIGLAHTNQQGGSRSELLRAADVAMYAAKSRHLGFSWYVANDDPHSRERLSLVEDLRDAIDRRAFDLHYQPRFDVQSGRVLGLEALIRWQHPTRGLLLPNHFIPLAERVGLIPAITRVVLDTGIAYIGHLRSLGHDLTLSVNISAKDLVDEDLADYVRETLAAHRVAPTVLTLEITETAVAQDPTRARRTLVRLRDSGIRVSIDDFGVGYSSMSQLLDLPLDELKIDRSFVFALDTDARAQAILSATVDLGRSLGLDVVAEGVETQEVLDELCRRGVVSAQGFLFSPALPTEALERLLLGLSDQEPTHRVAHTVSAEGGRYLL